MASPYVAALALAAMLAACGPGALTGSGQTDASASSSASAPESPAGNAAPSAAAGSPATSSSGSASSSGAPSTGFAFPASSVLAYYEKAGLTCGAPKPSDVADGWMVQECSGRDAEGQRLLVGVITDQDGQLGDGYASVTGSKANSLVGPEQALDHLSGFMGAMIGEQRASSHLEWLAGSMGNPYEETTDADLLIATYRQPRDDQHAIWLEIAGPGYPVPPAP